MTWNPQIQANSQHWANTGRGLEQLLASYGAGVSNNLSRITDQIDAQQEEDKKNARLFKSLQEMADVSGIVPKDKSTVMDLPTLQGFVQGHFAKQAETDAELNRRY